jgi:hypothetical protein
MTAYVQIDSCEPWAQDPSYSGKGHYPRQSSPRLSSAADVAAYTESIVPVEAVTWCDTIHNEDGRIATIASAKHNGRHYTIYTQTYTDAPLTPAETEEGRPALADALLSVASAVYSRR